MLAHDFQCAPKFILRRAGHYRRCLDVSNRQCVRNSIPGAKRDADIAIRDNSTQLTVFDDRQNTTISVPHHSSGTGERSVRPTTYDIRRHDIFDSRFCSFSHSHSHPGLSLLHRRPKPESSKTHGTHPVNDKTHLAALGKTPGTPKRYTLRRVYRDKHAINGKIAVSTHSGAGLLRLDEMRRTSSYLRGTYALEQLAESF